MPDNLATPKYAPHPKTAEQKAWEAEQAYKKEQEQRAKDLQAAKDQYQGYGDVYGQMYEQLGSQPSYARQAVERQVSAGRSAMASQAAGMGGAAAERAAMYGGADLQQRSYAQADQLAAQEMAQRRALQAQALQGQSQIYGAGVGQELGGVQSYAQQQQDWIDEQLRAQAQAAASQQYKDAASWPGTMAVGAGVGLATGAAMASDQRNKTDISKASGAEIDQLLQQLKTYQYDYDQKMGGRDLNLPTGRQTGVMAQDLERSKLGRNMVLNTPEGKAVDTGQATLTTMGLLGRLAERVGELEGKGAATPQGEQRLPDYWGTRAPQERGPEVRPGYPGYQEDPYARAVGGAGGAGGRGGEGGGAGPGYPTQDQIPPTDPYDMEAAERERYYRRQMLAPLDMTGESTYSFPDEYRGPEVMTRAPQLLSQQDEQERRSWQRLINDQERVEAKQQITNTASRLSPDELAIVHKTIGGQR